MSEQEIQVSEEQTRQKEQNYVNQNKSNDIRKVTAAKDGKSGDRSENLDKNKNDTSSASPGETVDIAISTKRTINPNAGLKKKNDNDDGDPYDPSRPITHRIEMAVKKFRKEHVSEKLRNQLFNSYLTFGGVNINKNQAEADGKNIADVEVIEVDFTYTVRVYLSGFLIDKSGYVQMNIFQEAPQVVILFLNYLSENNVCPEYEDDMQEALRIAHRAKYELPNCKELDFNAPGKFNKACSLLFGGELYGSLDDPFDDEEMAASMIGISKEEAIQLVKKVFGVKALTELRQIKEDSRYNLTCEIIDVEPFQTNILNASTNENRNSNTSGTQDANDENSVADSYESSDPNNNTQIIDETNLKKIMLREHNIAITEPFYISECSYITNYAIPGILITADFHKLSNGLSYWDNITNVCPSYYLACPDDDD
ncbi:hypothetical protein RclHR1_20210004 [Rhizophagus clarus]|uniref:Uncharacterized protein n=1 Tax=Rhizophagus clarus TaxID=94130 RepID=A0A2Z6QVJ1_9GLOM|nr:hypothetical protein RclHR1_20210004 [Rhizophagus clarus]